MADLSDKVKELAEIALLVPENLQTTCFELLLRDYLSSASGGKASAVKQNAPIGEGPVAVGVAPSEGSLEEAVDAQADIALTDLHMKARKFIEKYGVSAAEVNNLFYKDGSTISPLYEDLRTTKMSETQMRVTLLHALRNAFVTGDFSAQVSEVREECRDRKALDANNFAANYKNNKTLFDFARYDKSTATLRLSEEGKRGLAQVIKELQ